MTPRSVAVSILLPTYNRARFLPTAFEAIAGQSFRDWELIVVDDGSTDDSEQIVSRETAGFPQPVRYIKQANAGPYGARNTGLDLACGRYVAFYDSDDRWFPQYLASSVTALEAAPDVDWVYAACRIVDDATGRVMDPDTFVLNGSPRPFRHLKTERRGTMSVFADDGVVAMAVEHGLYCGLQNSVIRRRIFESTRFNNAFRNEAEDQLFVIRALKRGYRAGYIDDVHVEYHVHDANSSGSARGQTVDRELAIYRPVVRGFEELRSEFQWTPRERRALARRVAQEYFWHLGYSVLWQNGRRADALEYLRRGLRAWPWSPACWKTYLAARVRVAVGGQS